MSIPRDHHFIPVFYLKHWAVNRGRLIEYSRPYGNKLVAKEVSPKATGFQTDLYSFPECEPEVAQFLETTFLKRTDDLAARALAKLLSGDSTPWKSELRSAWSRFVFNFLIRHPHTYAEIKEALHQSWLAADSITQDEYESIRQPEDPLTFNEWVAKQGGDLIERIRIRLIQSVMDNQPLGTQINKMCWGVLDLGRASHRLLTSDWPLDRRLVTQVQYWALPVTPTHLFVASNHQTTFDVLRRHDPEKIVREMNIAVVSRARIYVWASDETQEIFIRNRMSSAILPTPFYPSLVKSTR